MVLLKCSEPKILKYISIMNQGQWVYGEICMPSVFEKDAEINTINNASLMMVYLCYEFCSGFLELGELLFLFF